MKIFNIEITETLSRIVPVEANSVEEAIEILKESYYKTHEYVLDYTDHINTDFKEHIEKQWHE